MTICIIVADNYIKLKNSLLLPERIIPIRSTSAVFQEFDCPITDTAIDAKLFIQDISQDVMVLKAELVFQNNSLLGIINLE